MSFEDDVGQGKGDVERAERDDERRQPHPRHERPVEHAEGDAGENAERDRRQRAEALVDRKLRHYDLPERHHGADGEVDPGREDHQGLTDREHADDHHLLQHEREIWTLQEAVALQREERHRQQQREERPDGGRREEAAGPVERRPGARWLG